MQVKYDKIRKPQLNSIKFTKLNRASLAADMSMKYGDKNFNEIILLRAFCGVVPFAAAQYG